MLDADQIPGSGGANFNMENHAAPCKGGGISLQWHSAHFAFCAPNRCLVRPRSVRVRTSCNSVEISTLFLDEKKTIILRLLNGMGYISG
jgi:hypothetical protein